MVEVGRRVPSEWVPAKTFARQINSTEYMVKKALEHYTTTEAEGIRTYQTIKGRTWTYISPELQEMLRRDVVEDNLAPEEWLTRSEITSRMRKRYPAIMKALEPYRDSHPHWLRMFRDRAGNVREHVSPELQKILETKLEPPKRRQSRLKTELSSFLREVGEKKTLEAKEFRQLVDLFGSERSMDILFHHRPEYRSISVPYVRSVLGDYLGDYFVLRGEFSLDKLEVAKGYLGDQSLKEGLTEVVKGTALRTYNEIKKAHPEVDDWEILAGYVQFLREETKYLDSPELQEVLDSAAEYYDELFTGIEKPEYLVDEIKENRLFPDVNQRINIREIKEKNKMLIADEMGLGKSASAILAKECLGVRQALVVAPSNVIDVWRTYLSDERGPNGEILGYFQEGQAPKVLIVNGEIPADVSDFDYVLLSQERLNNRTLASLERLEYDMMIVDEVHKLKNLESGKRAQQLIRLTERINGDPEKYLAILSGTPTPNKVQDIAMLLKLLYPERFESIPNKQLAQEIIKGDVLDLRSLLVPRMEIKELGESIQMPELVEELHHLELSPEEREVYNILLEEDELTATQKMLTMRQFILNPDLVMSTPGLEGTKAREFGAELARTFMTKDKVVMFVNGFVNGITRGPNTIFPQLNLPNDVHVRIIDGEVSKADRLEIQEELRSQNGKMLLIVSGQTADVGVDFTADR